MSTASSPPWTPASPIVRNTRVANDRKSASAGEAPVATCVGALAGSVIGAVAGALAGPGAFIAGAFLGGACGVMAARSFADPRGPGPGDEPYYASPHAFEDFGPAYRFGRETFPRYRGRRFDEVEPELARLWQARHDGLALGWEKAGNAVRRVWSRHAEAT